MSTSPLFWLRPLFICLTSQLYLWEYIWSSQQILTSLFGFLQIKAHSSKFYLVFRSRSVLESLRKFGLALNLWKWQCSEGVVWFGFNELFLSLFPDNSWCPYDALPCKRSLLAESYSRPENLLGCSHVGRSSWDPEERGSGWDRLIMELLLPHYLLYIIPHLSKNCCRSFFRLAFLS